MSKLESFKNKFRIDIYISQLLQVFHRFSVSLRSTSIFQIPHRKHCSLDRSFLHSLCSALVLFLLSKFSKI